MATSHCGDTNPLADEETDDYKNSCTNDNYVNYMNTFMLLLFHYFSKNECDFNKRSVVFQLKLWVPESSFTCRPPAL